MSNAANALPLRLRAAATAIANARGARRGALKIPNILDVLSESLFTQLVEDARAALDAADAADVIDAGTADPGRLRINLAKTVGLDLRSQAVVVLDVARDGIATISTWAARPGTPSMAIAEWARGLHAHALTAVPFQTVFGWGFGGRPTPLSPEQLATLNTQARAYADRNTIEPSA